MIAMSNNSTKIVDSTYINEDIGALGFEQQLHIAILKTRFDKMVTKTAKGT